MSGIGKLNVDKLINIYHIFLCSETLRFVIQVNYSNFLI